MAIEFCFACSSYDFISFSF